MSDFLTSHSKIDVKDSCICLIMTTELQISIFAFRQLKYFFKLLLNMNFKRLFDDLEEHEKM